MVHTLMGVESWSGSEARRLKMRGWLKIVCDLKVGPRAYQLQNCPCTAPVQESARSRWKLTCEGAESGLHAGTGSLVF